MLEKESVFIYGLIDPLSNELRYVGKSIKPNNRLRKHISERFTHDSYKDRWIRKIVDQGVRPELIIIDEVPYGEWQFWEQHYISYYKMIGCRLTNGTIGGDQPPSTKGRKHTEESKQKMSESKKGKAIPWLNGGLERSEEHRNNLSKSLKGRISPNKGKKFSDEYKNKLSESHRGLNSGEKHPMYGKTHSEETKKKISESSKKPRPNRLKPILQYSKDNKFIKEWESITHASDELKINNISACCNNKLKTAGGFIWKYKSNENGK